MTAAVVEAPIVCAETRILTADRLGDSYVRLVLAGPGLRAWSAQVVEPGTASDTYVKLLVPPPGGPGVAPDPGDLRSWLALPESERGWMRTYTVRRVDVAEVDGEQVPALTIDVVVHPGHDEGPGSAWAGSVAIGDSVRVLGPGRGHAAWRAWAPAQADRIVCAGDETAVPALLAIASELAAERAVADAAGPPAGEGRRAAEPLGRAGRRAAERDVRILVEMPTDADARALAGEMPGFVTAVARDGEPGTALVRALAGVLDLEDHCVTTVLDGRRPTEREWQPATAASAGDPYVFLAGEAGVVRAMRRLAVDAAGAPKRAVAFMGYWRRGAAES